ncbi:uncharacterized protein ACLA_008550 [Aspergillus clavatus NRRL 1]|uniref:Uncharacterized protein n=1 Tax=Aspergillus clavatus (strain ATCC 1007 / CBS 513.65 / DSM 816 / NCTC 3887 / NRRL 1 / QM 1276 / 107) TaxID=344612 RepID=A1CE18_ASPCL|nr:uncharacterized protein ACLA_008550 [Aspergillus clavatus NRRL 1]EAW12095.1 hypothetical protein ACLA_008550 [Aspergillus clavatus NRRL 1]
MSYNQVFKSSFIKNIIKNRKTLSVKYATKTSAWRRTQLGKSIQENFSQAIEKSDVPANAAKAILATLK